MSREEWNFVYISITIAIIGLFFAIVQIDLGENAIWVFLVILISFVSVIIFFKIYFKSLSSKSVVKQFKNSEIIDGKIQYFKSRNDLDLNEYLGIVEKEIIFLSLTSEFISKDVNLQKLIRYLITDKNISIRFLVLDPDSSIIDKICNFFGLDENEFKNNK